ncbi:hypothetical protein [Actinophytocola sp. NPDC049390]|uniref:hypothetical protein n=1 Tax=Actinophytocola sp. NPDC049390 TaxID=3363894 RepID=UPI0037A26B86
MSEFEAVLRSQVADGLKTLDKASQAGHDHEVHVHVARIRDLLDVAARHGIDTSEWVDAAVLESATLGD